MVQILDAVTSEFLVFGLVDSIACGGLGLLRRMLSSLGRITGSICRGLCTCYVDIMQGQHGLVARAVACAVPARLLAYMAAAVHVAPAAVTPSLHC